MSLGSLCPRIIVELTFHQGAGHTSLGVAPELCGAGEFLAFVRVLLSSRP